MILYVTELYNNGRGRLGAPEGGVERSQDPWSSELVSHGTSRDVGADALGEFIRRFRPLGARRGGLLDVNGALDGHEVLWFRLRRRLAPWQSGRSTGDGLSQGTRLRYAYRRTSLTRLRLAADHGAVSVISVDSLT